MGSLQGPRDWLCGWCRYLSCCPSGCPCKCGCPEICGQCDLCSCRCDCIPLLCPSEADKLKVEEVSAADYIHEKKKKVQRKLRQDTEAKAALRGFGAFCVGLFITTIYAAIVLFVKNYNLWFCLTTTATVGFFLSVGMAFSRRVRITVLLMLPQIFSAEAKTFILLAACALVAQGPTENLLVNFRQSSKSVACGAQVALNETRERIAKVTRPLMRFMNTIKNIGEKLRSSTSGVGKFFHKILNDIKNAGKAIRSAWHFMSQIGDYCNTELERPYMKCIKAFDTAKNNCFKIMSFMGFLCYILDVFRPLCGLAKIILLFCIVPHYVEAFVQKHIKNPVMSFVRNFKEQFEFNISYKFVDNPNNNSVKFSDAAGAMFKEIKENLETYKEMLSLFSYSMVLFCLYNYIKAVRYRRKYMKDDHYDNIYITRDFIELDVMRAKQNRETLLPLSPSEGYGFIRPGSLTLTRREKKGYTFDILNVFRSLLLALLMMSLDYVVFWMMSLVTHIMKGEPITRAPFVMSLLENGTGYSEQIFNTLTSAFDKIQQSNITKRVSKCLIQPSEPDYFQYLIIGFLHGFACCIAVFGIYMQRLRRYVCAYYYPTREKARICFLYNQLLTKRLQLETSLVQSIRANEVDKGHTNILLILAAQCPCIFRWLAKFVGAKQEYCMSCAQICTSKNNMEYHRCSTPGCKGLYCPGCTKILKVSCTICMGPLLCVDFVDEEIDSSDDERIELWMDGMKSIKEDEKLKKKQMKKAIKGRLKETFRRRGKNSPLIQKYKESKTASDSEESSGLSDVDTGEEEESDCEYIKSKVSDISCDNWLSPSQNSQQKANLIPLPGVPKTTEDSRRCRKERDEEKELSN